MIENGWTDRLMKRRQKFRDIFAKPFIEIWRTIVAWQVYEYRNGYRAGWEKGKRQRMEDFSHQKIK